MLRLHNPNNSAEVFPLDGLGPAITHPFDGFDTLSFDIPMSHEYYPLIAEEVRISTKDNRFAVKSVDEHGDVCTVECMLDLDDWKERFWKEYRTTDALLSEVLNEIKPTGWTVEGAGISTQHKTIEASEGKPLELVNSMDILGRATEVYEVCVNFNVPDKRLKVIDPSTYTPSGEYLTDELNLRSISFMGSTTDFATRLYAYGKEGMTFADINGGKEYVEDFTYSDRILSVGWKDERYTIQENLLAAAKEKLKSLAFPERSYELDVIDLAKGNPNYSFLTFWLYQVVTLLDRKRGTRVDHQIVEYVEYPESPGDSTVVLSATMPRIENVVHEVSTQIDESKTETENFMLDAIENATGLITGAKGGYVVIGQNPQGQPVEILIMDAPDIDTAQHVWRWNNGGLGYSSNGYDGPYATAITQDGAIVADFITAGTMSANLVRAGVLASQNDLLRFDLDDATLSVYADNTTKTLLMQMRSDGTWYYKNGVTVGKIGTDALADTALHSLVFSLESTGDMMAWAQETASGGQYDIKFSYLPKPLTINGGTFNAGLHIWGPLYTDGNPIYLNNVIRSSYWGNNQAGFRMEGGAFIVAEGTSTYFSASTPDNQVLFYRDINMMGNSVLNQSDARLKEKIEDSQISGMELINQLEVKSFDWINKNTHQEAGFIAQQVQEVIPSLIHDGGENGLSIKTSEMIPYLVKAIQELSDRVYQLEASTGQSKAMGKVLQEKWEDPYTEDEKMDFVQHLEQKARLDEIQPQQVILERKVNADGN